MAVIRSFETENIVACYEEATGGGAIGDFDAPRNAPAKNPGAHIDKVTWHIDFFQYELAMPIQTVVVNHATLAGRESFWGPQNMFWMFDPTYVSAISYSVPGQTAVAQHTLVTHNLGYVPLAFVAYNGRMVMPGVAVQTASDGRSRFVSAYATSSVIGLREVYNSSDAALPGVSRTYQVIIFRVPAIDADLPLFSRRAGRVVIGRGKIDTDRQYLRRTGSGDTPFDIDLGPTIDIDKGRARIVTGGSATTEAGYAGSFAGPDYIAVGV